MFWVVVYLVGFFLVFFNFVVVLGFVGIVVSNLAEVFIFMEFKSWLGELGVSR